jgi:hypothetical protein
MDSFTASPSSLTGQVRGIQSLAAKWAYGFRFKLWSVEEHLAWRGITALNYGIAGLIRVKVCDCRYSPKLIVNGVEVSISSIGVPHSDKTPHSDGTFYSDDLTSSLSQGAEVGDTQIDVITDNSIKIYPGHQFSDGDRFYRVASVQELANNRRRLIFYPRLRADIPFGKIVSFRDIYCIMRMRGDDMLRIDSEGLRIGEGNVDFEEALV